MAVSLYLLFPPPPNSLKVLQRNAGVSEPEALNIYFISSHPIDLICIQKLNLILFSSFRIPEFSALRCNSTYCRSGIFSTDVTHANGGVIIFMRQGLSLSELSTSSLSLLDPYSDYAEVLLNLIS